MWSLPRNPWPVAWLGVALVLGPLPGCFFQNASPTVRLKDNVDALNSDLRWGRIELALQMVAPAYRRTFVTARTRWGHDLQIADSDVLGIRVVEDEDAAVSTVDVRWYSQATMTVRQTQVQQRWELAGREYYLADEAVTGGDARLLPGVPVVDPVDLLLGDEDADAEARGEAGAGGETPTAKTGAVSRRPPPPT